VEDKIHKPKVNPKKAVWQFMDTGIRGWVPYDEFAQAVLERAFKECDPSVQLTHGVFAKDGFTVVFDYQNRNSEQRNNRTGNRRQVRRALAELDPLIGVVGDSAEEEEFTAFRPPFFSSPSPSQSQSMTQSKGKGKGKGKEREGSPKASKLAAPQPASASTTSLPTQKEGHLDNTTPAPASPPLAPEAPTPFGKQMQLIFDNKDYFPDVCFSFEGGENIYCHKVVLR
jgi:hypothetical protein